MTVTSNVPVARYLENGETLEFAAPFRFLDPADLVVTREIYGAEEELAYGLDWSATGGADDGGGTVALVLSLPGSTLTIARRTPRNQQVDYDPNARFPAETHERALDKLTMAQQEQDPQIARSVKVPYGEAGLTLPGAAERADQYLRFDAAGKPALGDPDQFAAPARAAAEQAELAYTAGLGLSNYRKTLLAGVTAFGVGGFFSSAETGELRIYERIAAAPYYEDQGDAAAPLTKLLAAKAPFSHAATYPAGSLGAKLKMIVSPCDAPFNCVGDGVTDDTAGFQAAVNFVANSSRTRTLWLPGNAVFKLTAPIVSAKPLHIRGEGFEPYAGRPTGSSRGAGSWLYFAHGGKGLVFDNSAAGGPFTTISGVQLDKFGTFRDQPAPAPGWAPNDHDFDIWFNGVSCEVERLLLLNATRGIGSVRGGYGRFSARRVWGQFFKVGIFMDKQYDLPIIEHFRAWPFWSDDFYTREYCYNNLDALHLLKVDNPMLAQFFSIFHRASIRIGQSANDLIDPGHFPGGSVSLLRGTNLDMDIGLTGVWIDSSVTTHEVTAEFVNLHTQSDDRVGSVGVLVESERSRLSFVNFTCVATHANAVRAVVGSGNRIELSGLVTVIRYNTALAGFSAFEASGTNQIILKTPPFVPIQLNNAPIYGGAKLAFDNYPVEGASQRVTIANGGNCALPKGAALVAVSRVDSTNHSAVYLVANGAVSLVSEIGGTWVAPTTTPAAGKLSVAWNGVNYYTIYNNTGGAVTITLGGIRMAETN